MTTWAVKPFKPTPMLGAVQKVPLPRIKKLTEKES